MRDLDLPIPYGRQTVDASDIAAVTRVLNGNWLTQGPAVPEFEAALCASFGATHAIAVNSGTAALHAGMMALGIGSGDLVIVPPITFVASANAALYCGGEVAFVDIEPDTGLIDPDALDDFLSKYNGPHTPKAAVAVHYAGLPCDMVRLQSICEHHGIDLIEDACHAPGATWTDAGAASRHVGACDVSAFATFSFHPVKHVTTAEGGAVLTRRSDLAEGARLARTHGITKDPDQMQSREGPWWHEQHHLGFNYRMPDVLAALGSSQLARLPIWIERRREIAARYRALFADHDDITLQTEPEGRRNAYHLFPILVESRREVFDELVRRGIRVQVHYIPVHRQPYYRTRYGSQNFPVAEEWYRREISLPMFPTMSDAQVEYVAKAVREVVADNESARPPTQT